MNETEINKATKWNLIIEGEYLEKMPELEIWFDVPLYTGIYQVSSMGRVRSLDKLRRVWVDDSFEDALIKGKIIDQEELEDGSKTVTLKKRGRSRTFPVEELVAKAFVPNPTIKNGVEHKDQDKSNNNMTNLRWVSGQEDLEDYATTKEGKREVMIRAVQKNPDYYFKDLMEDFDIGQSLAFNLRRYADLFRHSM